MALLASTLPAGTKYATPQELLSLFAENLSVPASDANIFVLSPTAPNDQTKIWIDTSGANPLLKIYLSGGWTSISVGSAFSGGLSVTGGNIRLLATALSIDNTGTYAGRVGIGTITPDTTLHVAGTAKATTSVVTPAIASTAGTLAITGAVTTTAGITVNSGNLVLSAGSITCSGGVSSSGPLSGTTLTLTGEVSSNSISTSGTVTAGSLALTGASINSSGAMTLSSISASSRVSVGSLSRGAPVEKTSSFTVGATENWLIVNMAATCTVTLPAAADWVGREITIKTVQNRAVNSASDNVLPKTTMTPGNVILSNTDGSWCTLVSNGTYWVNMAS